MRNSVLPFERCIAHVLMHDEQGRIVLYETSFERDWELPGGIVEPFESPWLGAVREVQEELGIDLPVGRLLVVDWMPRNLGWDDGIELIVDNDVVTEADLGSWTVQPSEIKRVGLVTLEAAASW